MHVFCFISKGQILREFQNIEKFLIYGENYSQSSLNGHSRKRTALLTAALFETPFYLPYKLCIFTFS